MLTLCLCRPSCAPSCILPRLRFKRTNRCSSRVRAHGHMQGRPLEATGPSFLLSQSTPYGSKCMTLGFLKAVALQDFAVLVDWCIWGHPEHCQACLVTSGVDRELYHSLSQSGQEMGARSRQQLHGCMTTSEAEAFSLKRMYDVGFLTDWPAWRTAFRRTKLCKHACVHRRIKSGLWQYPLWLICHCSWAHADRTRASSLCCKRPPVGLIMKGAPGIASKAPNSPTLVGL